MEARDLSFSAIAVNDSASFTRLITEKDVSDFAALSGDTNPLHLDTAYAAKTRFGRPIAHGMFLGALCSQLVGMHLPGKRCLYLGQTLTFKKPVFPGDAVTIIGTVTAKSESTRIIELAIDITNGHDIVATGIARVQLLE